MRKAGAAAAFFVMLSLPNAALTQDASVSSQINAANELVRQGKPVEAISAFSEIQSNEARDTVNYNLAVAHYRNSDYAAAQTLFEQTTASSDTMLAANSRYNLGNCLYASALESAKQGRDAAIASLESAISHYRSSLRLDRTNSDARANIELAKRLLDQLKAQQEQQQQQQQQQNPEQQNEQQNQDQNQSSEQQDSEQQNSEQPDPNNQSDSNSQQSDQKQTDESQQQDSSQQENDGESSQDEQQPQNQSEGQKQENQQESQQQNSQSKPRDQSESTAQQQANQNKPDESEPDAGDKQGDDEQKETSGELTAANEANEAKPDDPKQKAARLADQQNGLMTREEALKMLQSVRDRDMIRRLRQQQRERSRRIPVERDW